MLMPESFDAIPPSSPLLDEEGELLNEPTNAHYLRDVRSDLRHAMRYAIENLKRDIEECDSEETRADCERLLRWLKRTWEEMP